MPSTSQMFLLVLSLLGFLTSLFIFSKRKYKEKLVCVLGKDCGKVINSKFSRQLGISNEVVGLLYYTAVFISTLILVAIPTLVTIPVLWIQFLGIATAALFSLYLIFLQLVIIKELCEYCLIVNVTNILLFFALKVG
ncbi:MAG TPA: vitamin K epoxide reductase family protein [Nanoarchaeota archaeon]|nr:MAG: hypothetical protein QT01_C0004G0030 [archaeon GW2011_AR6]MBS3082611.1 vitamin K epoxide reductase family protein [Candidatus Pacearchaeota archaeon]HIH17503.1 vitamin K epoxide reductase family protein [Nanoarchaeota archaeon]HIH33689.1 vitamin K epoxide reductase family protein [Nanoarchaeota archaeon]HIH51477.1 vitamin K epoxide reductase family protein [Nanoarchaeota archaeon]